MPISRLYALLHVTMRANNLFYQLFQILIIRILLKIDCEKSENPDNPYCNLLPDYTMFKRVEKNSFFFFFKPSKLEVWKASVEQFPEIQTLKQKRIAGVSCFVSETGKPYLPPPPPHTAPRTGGPALPLSPAVDKPDQNILWFITFPLSQRSLFILSPKNCKSFGIMHWHTFH